MALGAQLGGAGLTPEKIETKAAVTLAKADGGFAITKIALTTTATVPGATKEAFDKAAADAKAGCPISKLFANNTRDRPRRQAGLAMLALRRGPFFGFRAARRPDWDTTSGLRKLTPAGSFARLKDAAGSANPAEHVYRAEVAELADARGSGPRTRKGVGVRVPSSAPRKRARSLLRYKYKQKDKLMGRYRASQVVNLQGP